MRQAKEFFVKIILNRDKLLNRDKNNQQKLPHGSILAHKHISFRGIQDDGSTHIKPK